MILKRDIFLSQIHEARYNELLQKDSTSSQDIERQALFYILSGNQDLYSKIDNLYDFQEHSILIEESEQTDFSLGIRGLLELALNLYNGYGERTIRDIFANLDNQNSQLAINAIQFRFHIQEQTYNNEYEETEEEKEIFREMTERRKIRGAEIMEEKFKPVLFCDIGTRTHNIHLTELKLYAYADTLEEAIEQITDLVVDHYQAYIDGFLIPDRKKQLPYIALLSHGQNREEIKELIFEGIFEEHHFTSASFLENGH